MRGIVTALLVLMTAGLAVCGFLLWRRRKETGDYSRTIQAVLSWVSAFFTATFLFRTWAGTSTADGAFFEPEHTFIPLLAQMTYFLYPLEVIKPAVSRIKVYAFLFVPLLALFFVGMCAGVEYTPIYTYTDLWQHIWEPNVLLRLVTLTVMLFYAFSLFFVPYNWKSSSVSKKFILNYAVGFSLMGVLHFSIQITHSYWLVVMHHLVWMSLFLAVARYELKERLVVLQESDENSSVEVAAENTPVDVDTSVENVEEDALEVTDKPQADELWEKILVVLDQQEQWRNPELTLTSLSRLVFSNRTYVGDAFKRNAGLTFSEYIAKRRIGYVADALRENPHSDVKELFHYAGYRSRSAGWENFHKIMGASPSEYIANL